MPLETQFLLRAVYACLMLILFALIAPFGRTYFVSEKYRGFIQSSPKTDWLFNPAGYQIIRAVWIVALAGLLSGTLPLLSALVNLLFCYVFFVRLRWYSITRGMGAPGFISFWLAALIFLLEYATAFGDRAGGLRDLVLLTFQVDMGVMMLDTGINKVFHGYRTNEGMNYGMVNPAWGYWADFLKHLKSDHFIFRFSNHCAYIFQILGGSLMLIPGVRWIGAAVIAISFVVVKIQIRLGVLCDQVILMTLIFTGTGGWVHQVTQNLFPQAAQTPVGSMALGGPWNAILSTVLWAYIILLPLAKCGMYYNFYGQKRLPELLQGALERFTNTFGIILWRVFTFELIEYFMVAYFENKKSGERRQVTRYGGWSFTKTNRFLWVGENITAVVVFNTLRYFGQDEMFRARVLRYAKTLNPPEDCFVVFQHVTIMPGRTSYEYRPAREYYADLAKETVETKVVDPEVPVYRQRKGSPVHVSAKPGSYAPAKS